MFSSSLATSPGVDPAMRTKNMSSIMKIRFLAILLIFHHLLLTLQLVWVRSPGTRVTTTDRSNFGDQP